MAELTIGQRKISRVLIGVTGGLLAGVAAGVSDRLLERLVSPEQKRRERQVREAPAHKAAAPYFVAKIRGKELAEHEKKRAQAIFSLAYGIMWGLLYAGVRRKFPRASRLVGLPFGIPFFFACDGILAPLLGVSPSLRRIPWQVSLKEMGNHIAWAAAAEMVHRAAIKRLLPR